MSEELPKIYEPKDVEKKWYKIWNDGNYFAPRKNPEKESFCIIMPPPNVTGILHAGHALNITNQDTLIRFKRMKGHEALLLPGMDHAGIATQSKVEDLVWKEEGKKRSDFTKEEFLKKIWDWKNKHGDIISDQQKRMGVSCDWSQFLFTMSDEANEAVRKAFVTLYNNGLIYQSNYIVNWDPLLQSAISDAEVEHREVQGFFYHIHYKVKNSDLVLEIATTRPETLLGDTAIAVNPKDERFSHLIGEKAIIPICNREIPIIGDEYVDIEKGTGCLKVTPGHDFNDFEIGKRHQLETINLLNKDGTLNEYGLSWKGLTTKKARKEILKKLKELNLLVKEEKHTHQVGHGDRSGVIIEPIVSKQWFIKMKKMAQDAVSIIENDTIKFYPKNWENTYFSFLKSPKDWCVSRQLLWGHRIPIFTCDECQHQWADEQIHPENCPKCSKKNYHQDPDVLDTWFSSGLWPLTTLGWPNPARMKEKGFERFYPSSVLITAFDIIFFWVARMIMIGMNFNPKVPFPKVYIHAMVRDKFGKKMSKSLGNGIDPIQMCEQYGTDAFRFTLASDSGYGRNINLDPERTSGYRSFINKIWNAFRFIHPFLSEGENKVPAILDDQEKWILSELNNTTKIVNESLEEFRYDNACSIIYSFVYDRFCSWFIELSKSILNQNENEIKTRRISVLRYSFRKVLLLLHPITPFITEEIWQYLKEKEEGLLIVQEYPEFKNTLLFTSEQESMTKFIEIIQAIRFLRQSVNISPRKEIEVKLFSDDEEVLDFLSSNISGIQELTRAKKVNILNKFADRPHKAIMKATTHTEVFLPLEGVINLEEQIARLTKEKNKVQKELDKISKKINNENFIANAKEEVVLEVKDKFSQFEEQLKSLNQRIKSFES